MTFLRNILSACLLTVSFFIHAQKPDLHFKHITTQDGLSHSNVKAIVKDYQGFMWFGSTFGLNRYDGYSITTYLKANNTGIADNDIIALYEDSNNNLWIATQSGLNRYNREHDNFTSYNELQGRYIKGVLEDSKQNLWAYGGQFLFRYNVEKNIFEPYLTVEPEVLVFFEDRDGTLWLSADKLYTYNPDTKKLTSSPNLSLQNINAIYQDSGDVLWMLSYGDGVYAYEKDTGTITRYGQDSSSKKGIPTNTVTCISEDKHGNIWIGTLQKGLIIFDQKTQAFYNYQSIPGNSESLGFNSVKYVYCDNEGYMWVGTYSSGVDFISERKFSHFSHSPFDQNSLNNNSIITLAEDRKGNLLIGTDGGGLNIYTPQKGDFKHYTHDPGMPGSIGSDIVSAVWEGPEGELWVGCWDAGLYRLDRKTGKAQRYVYDDEHPMGGIVQNSVLYLYGDSRNNLWIGTQAGLAKMDLSTLQKNRFDDPEAGLKNYINCLIEDEDGTIWAGTWAGLAIVDEEKKVFKRFMHSDGDTTTISDDRIFALHIDRKDRFWIGTSGGLNYYDRKENVFGAYRVKDGLPSDAVYGILEDDSGHLWLSTANGISKFNPEEVSFENYTVNDGLQGNQFKEHAYVRLSNGMIAFGGVNGFNLFVPENIFDNPNAPPVVITDFKIFYKSIKVTDKNSPLTKHISLTDEIKLTHNESVFSFDFAALNYLAPEKNRYAYQLEGFESGWNYVGHDRKATYTNLNAGEYVFRVKAANNDGVWNMDGVSVQIRITPPFWKTWWFVAALCVVCSCLIISLIRLRINAIKEQKAVLEQQVKERTSEIVQKNTQLELQATRLQTANNEIRDNIKAAEALQKNVFPNEDKVRKHFEDFFVMHIPKDVVSGDFYWFDIKDGHKIVAVGDCIGHGVSGAFMSVNAHHLLHKAVYSHPDLDPSAILNKLNDEVLNMFHSNPNDDFDGGMDISICIFSPENSKILFSGANLPLYLLRHGEIIQVKGNPAPIGSNIVAINGYTVHHFPLKKGDTVYVFSDGYADQIGGPDRNEKFKYPRFRELLVKMGDKDMQTQKAQLESVILRWKGECEQLDDIIVLGIKV